MSQFIRRPSRRDTWSLPREWLVGSSPSVATGDSGVATVCCSIHTQRRYTSSWHVKGARQRREKWRDAGRCGNRGNTGDGLCEFPVSCPTAFGVSTVAFAIWLTLRIKYNAVRRTQVLGQLRHPPRETNARCDSRLTQFLIFFFFYSYIPMTLARREEYRVFYFF